MEKDKVSIIRYRGTNSKLSKVKELDLFPKVDEKCKEHSPIGGICKANEYCLLIDINLFCFSITTKFWFYILVNIFRNQLLLTQQICI